MYSRSSVLMTSTMKSDPGRSTTMSPGIIRSFLDVRPSDGAGSAAPLSSTGSAAATVVAAATAETAVVFRNVRRSRPAFFSSAIAFLLCARRGFRSEKSIIEDWRRNAVPYPGTTRGNPDEDQDHAAGRGGRAHREGWANARDGRLYPSDSLRRRPRGHPP